MHLPREGPRRRGAVAGAGVWLLARRTPDLARTKSERQGPPQATARWVREHGQRLELSTGCEAGARGALGVQCPGRDPRAWPREKDLGPLSLPHFCPQRPKFSRTAPPAEGPGRIPRLGSASGHPEVALRACPESGGADGVPGPRTLATGPLMLGHFILES